MQYIRAALRLPENRLHAAPRKVTKEKDINQFYRNKFTGMRTGAGFPSLFFRRSMQPGLRSTVLQRDLAA